MINKNCAEQESKIYQNLFIHQNLISCSPCSDAIIEMLGEDPDSSSLSHNLPPDKFYNPGSHISLKCIIRRYLIKNATVQDITNVSWKKNGVIIDLQTQERIRQACNLSPVL